MRLWDDLREEEPRRPISRELELPRFRRSFVRPSVRSLAGAWQNDALEEAARVRRALLS